MEETASGASAAPQQLPSVAADSEVDKARRERFIGPIDAFRVLRHSSFDKVDEALEDLLPDDAIDRLLYRRLGSKKPLKSTQEFTSAHRKFARALEIYARQTKLAPERLLLGPLRPIALPLITLIGTTIARIYQKRMLKEISGLYALREANSLIGSDEHMALMIARRQIEAVSDSTNQRTLALPGFLLGGAVLSMLVSFISDLMANAWGRIGFLGVTLVFTVGAFWCILMAAAVTKRRVRLIIEAPLKSLWEAVGNAGDPPRDPTKQIVLGATVLLIIGWVVAPAAIALFFALF